MIPIPHRLFLRTTPHKELYRNHIYNTSMAHQGYLLDQRFTSFQQFLEVEYLLRIHRWPLLKFMKHIFEKTKYHNLQDSNYRKFQKYLNDHGYSWLWNCCWWYLSKYFSGSYHRFCSAFQVPCHHISLHIFRTSKASTETILAAHYSSTWTTSFLYNITKLVWRLGYVVHLNPFF